MSAHTDFIEVPSERRYNFSLCSLALSFEREKQGHSEFPDVEGERELAVEEVTGGAVTNQGSESGN